MRAGTVCTGSCFTVEWAKTRSGSRPALEFFDGLSQPEKAKVLMLIQLFAESPRIRNPEKFKKLQEGLFEFKSFQVRLLGDYRPGRTFVIAWGLKKKKDRHNPEDLAKAMRILEEHDNQAGR